MQVIRVISYESDDPKRMADQLGRALEDGSYPDWATAITVGTVPESNGELLAQLREFLAQFKSVPHTFTRKV
jgi:hypothetical protein